MVMLEERLRAMADLMLSMPGRTYVLEDFVLRHANVRGRVGAELIMVERGVPKECFSNAYQLATRVGNLRYCEGYAMDTSIGLPFLHAWVVNAEGDIIDNTLERAERCEYVGIRFSTRTLLRETNRTGYYGLLDCGRGYNTVLMDRMDKKVSKSATSTQEIGKHG